MVRNRTTCLTLIYAEYTSRRSTYMLKHIPHRCCSSAAWMFESHANYPLRLLKHEQDDELVLSCLRFASIYYFAWQTRYKRHLSNILLWREALHVFHYPSSSVYTLADRAKASSIPYFCVEARNCSTEYGCFGQLSSFASTFDCMNNRLPSIAIKSATWKNGMSLFMYCIFIIICRQHLICLARKIRFFVQKICFRIIYFINRLSLNIN